MFLVFHPRVFLEIKFQDVGKAIVSNIYKQFLGLLIFVKVVVYKNSSEAIFSINLKQFHKFFKCFAIYD